jgi:hypothetical protein
MARHRKGVSVSLVVFALGNAAVAAFSIACSSSTDYTNYPFGIQCEMTEEDGGCICYLSTTPNTLSCSGAAVGGVCRKASSWPQPQGSSYSSYSSTALYSRRDPGCQCLPPTPPGIKCSGQDSTGAIGRDASCSCSRTFDAPPSPTSTSSSSSSSSSTNRNVPCQVKPGLTGICCASEDSCTCSTYANTKCAATEKKVTSCTEALFQPDPERTPNFAESASSSTDTNGDEVTSCVNVQVDRSKIAARFFQ